MKMNNDNLVKVCIRTGLKGRMAGELPVKRIKKKKRSVGDC